MESKSSALYWRLLLIQFILKKKQKKYTFEELLKAMHKHCILSGLVHINLKRLATTPSFYSPPKSISLWKGTGSARACCPRADLDQRLTESIQWPFSAESVQHPKVQQSMPLVMVSIESVTRNSHVQRLMDCGKPMNCWELRNSEWRKAPILIDTKRERTTLKGYPGPGCCRQAR